MPEEDWVPVRAVRVPDERWRAAKEKAARRSMTMTDVVNQLLERWIREDPLDEPFWRD